MQIIPGAHTSLLFSGYRISFPRVMSGALPLLPLYAIMCLFVTVVLVASHILFTFKHCEVPSKYL